LNIDLAAGHRMGKSQAIGMEKLSVKPEFTQRPILVGVSVYPISGDGEPDSLCMRSDLMKTACFDPHPHQCVF
jgi:hypothetical protein